MSTVIVGAGLAGLAAARTFHERGKGFVLIEATDRVGGRVRSFHTPEGFVLDRGFQVILDSYPTLRRFVKVERLDPCYFPAGARIVLADGTVREVVHPLRHFGRLWEMVRTDVFTAREKLALIGIGIRALFTGSRRVFSIAAQSAESEPSTRELLTAAGIGERAIRNFFRPFFGGVLLDQSLETSSSVFFYYFRMFLLGRAFLPAGGMECLPLELARPLPTEAVRLKSEVLRIRVKDGRAVAVQMVDGTEIPCDCLILATDEPTTARLLGRRTPPRPAHAVWTFYFSHKEPSASGAWLVLNAGEGCVLHCAQISAVSSRVAPPGRRLISATALHAVDGEMPEEQLEAIVRREVAKLQRLSEDSLQPVGRIFIDYAVPQQPPGFLPALQRNSGFENVWLAGDQVTPACIEGALRSGREAALAAQEWQQRQR